LGCGVSRTPHFDTNGGEVFQLYAQAALYPQEDSWYSFLSKAGSTLRYSAAGRITSIEISIDIIRNQTRDLPACRLVP
jgi:hypothetical protein